MGLMPMTEGAQSRHAKLQGKLPPAWMHGLVHDEPSNEGLIAS